MDGEHIEEQLRKLLEHSDEDLAAAYLFGSVARGQERARSDVDVALLYRGPPSRGLEALGLTVESQLEAALGRPVQVVVLNDAPPDLVHRVLRDGRIVLERDRSARIRFEVHARSEFLDLQPVLRRYRWPRETPR